MIIDITVENNDTGDNETEINLDTNELTDLELGEFVRGLIEELEAGL